MAFSNIPQNPAYGVYVSRLVCFARACSEFDDFASRHILVQKLLSQGYEIKVLRKQFSKFFQCHHSRVSNWQKGPYLRSLMHRKGTELQHTFPERY